jgi:hypothetical protein
MSRVCFAGAVPALLAALALAPSGRSDAADGQQWGLIKGQVVWEGPIPERKVVEKVKENQDAKFCESRGPVLTEEFVINKENRGVRWALVWLLPDPPTSKQPLPVHPDLQKIKDPEVVIDQPCCLFEPHVLGMREGQTLVAKNSAKVVHNVSWTVDPRVNGRGGNQAVPAGKKLDIPDLKAQRLPITVSCTIHPWMSARVGVFNHPYFAVTDADGKFEIKQAPAGKYRLMVWQEGVGYLGGAAGRNGTPITIKGDAKGEAVTDLGQFKMKKGED